MKTKIEIEIRKAITRHLVQHVQVPKEDNRDRIDVLIDEASTEIIKIIIDVLSSLKETRFYFRA